MKKLFQQFCFYRLLLLWVFTGATSFNSYSQCSSCTTTINSNITQVYTVLTGTTVCVVSGFDYTGTIILSGGTLCNEGTVHNITFNSGVFENYGTYSKTSGTVSIANSGIVYFNCHLGSIVTLNKLSISGSAQLELNMYAGSEFNLNSTLTMNTSAGNANYDVKIFVDAEAILDVAGDVNVSRGKLQLDNGNPNFRCAVLPCTSTMNFAQQFNISNSASLFLTNNTNAFFNVHGSISFSNTGDKIVANSGVLNVGTDFNISGNGQSVGSILIANIGTLNINRNLSVTYTNGTCEIRNVSSYQKLGAAAIIIGGNYSQSQTNNIFKNYSYLSVAKDINVGKGNFENYTRGFVQARTLDVKQGVLSNADVSSIYLTGNLITSNLAAVINNGGSIDVANTINNKATINLSATSSINTNHFTNQQAGIITRVSGISDRIFVGGNWLNAGIIDSQGGEVVFNGTVPVQNVDHSGGTKTFYVLTVEKPIGSIVLSSPVKISNTLNLFSGIVTTTATNILEISDNAISSEGFDNAYVSGPMKKIGDDAFTFPIGSEALPAGALHPLSISAPLNATDAYTAQYFPVSQTIGSALEPDNIESISDCEHWMLTRNAGTSVVIPSLGWNINDCSYNNGNMRVAGWDGSKWISLGNMQYVDNNFSGVITASMGYDASSLPLAIARNKQLQISSTVVDVNCVTQTLGSISITPLGGFPPYTFLWSNGSTSQNQTNLSEGIYTITVKDNANNTFTKQFQLYTCIDWTDLNNVTVSGESLTKTAVDGWGNAGAKSKNLLYETAAGAIRYKVENLSKSFFVGLSVEEKNDLLFENTKFGFWLDGSSLKTYVDGVLTNTYSGIKKNDVIELIRTENDVKFIKNTVVLISIASVNQSALKVDFIPFKQDNTVSNIKATFGKPRFALNTKLMSSEVIGNDNIDIEISLNGSFVKNIKSGAIELLALPQPFSSNATYDFKFNKTSLQETLLKCVTTRYGAVQSLSIFNDTIYVPLDSLFFVVKDKRELILVPLNSSAAELNVPVTYLNLDGGIVLSPDGDGNFDLLSLHGGEKISSFQLDVYNLAEELIFQTNQKTFQWDGKDPAMNLVKGTYNYEMTVDGSVVSGSFLIDF